MYAAKTTKKSFLEKFTWKKIHPQVITTVYIRGHAEFMKEDLLIQVHIIGACNHTKNTSKPKLNKKL